MGEIESKNSRPYCAMPWVHLHVSDFGKVKACCVANIPFGNVNKDALNDIWNGESIHKLRSIFKEGRPDNRCSVCVNQEKAGAKSIRQETWDKYHDLSDFPVNVDALPTYFDIRFSNLCNFKCRTCWHGASSKWHADALLLERTKKTQALIENIRDLNPFINIYGSALKQAKEIYFAGGEPLITEAHYQLLEWLISEKATDCLLRYNTNFSVLSFKHYNLPELWSHFKSVEILASIDAMGNLGEFIRSEMIWEKFLQNRQSLTQLQNVKFKLAPTVSILSIFHLPDLYQWAFENRIIIPSYFYINMVDRPFYYNVKAFPKAQKDIIRKKYRAFFVWCATNHIPISVQKDFKSCLEFMDSEDLSKHWSSFINETKIINELRNEKLMDNWYQDLGLNE